MARQQELFAKPKRRSPRVLAKSDDHGHFPDGRQAAHFVCRCGWNEWLSCTWSEAIRGIACPDCNEGVSYE
jgi:hypothetical protein